MMPELSQRRPAATTTIATDEAGDQAAEDREDEDKDEDDEKQLSSQHRIIKSTIQQANKPATWRIKRKPCPVCRVPTKLN